MIYPDYRRFKALSEQGNLIPVYTELMADLETPLSAYMKLGNSPYSFLLESVEGGEKWARYSFISSNPRFIFIATDKSAYLLENKRKVMESTSSDFMDLLKNVMKGYTPALDESLPDFIGGAVGYISYDWVKKFEKVPDTSRDELKLPSAIFVLTDTSVVFDNLRHKLIVIANAHLNNESMAKTYNRALSKIESIVKLLKKPLKYRPKKKPFSKKISFGSNFTKEKFIKIVNTAKGYIEDGEIIQVVLSQRFETETKVEPLDVYRALRLINPSPYMYFLNFDNIKIAGSSPELLVKLKGKEMTLRPIAGTRPRGKTPEEDRKLADELLSDTKELAEHIMLVDLGRNDLGRVAVPGSVKLNDLMYIEKYSHVMHIVSTITGIISEGNNCFDLLKATFPAGTVTGAPKVRAMQIIEELEKTKRGPYAGAVGYFGFNGNMDMAINLRTAIFTHNRIYIQAGAGIVFDSIPEREYEETVNKAKGMLKAVEMVSQGFKI
jgi:anthranilate synthase component 1